MNDRDLKNLLQRVHVPERPEEYWEDFPGRVRGQLRQRRSAAAPRPAWRLRLVWAGDFALTAALVLFCLEYHPLQLASAAITQNEHYIHARMARLDAGLHRLMLNTDGMGYLLAEAN